MNQFFSMDGALYRALAVLSDVLILGILWMVFSLPVVTIGASTTAAYFVSTRRISNREGGVARDFWRSFRLNFKQATFLWLIWLVLMAAVGFNIYSMSTVTADQMSETMASILFGVQIAFVLEGYLLYTYLFPLLARFEMKNWLLIKTAFRLAHKHLFTSLLCLAVLAAVVALTVWTGFFIILAAGTYIFLVSLLLMRLFRKYRPGLDKKEPEDE